MLDKQRMRYNHEMLRKALVLQRNAVFGFSE